MSSSPSSLPSWPSYAAIFAVGVIWGLTNPYIARGAKSSPDGGKKEKKHDALLVKRIVLQVVYFFSNWKYTLPFAINRAASLVFLLVTLTVPVAHVVVLTNAVAIAITGVVGHVLGEKMNLLTTVTGVGFIVAGIAVINYGLFD